MQWSIIALSDEPLMGNTFPINHFIFIEINPSDENTGACLFPWNILDKINQMFPTLYTKLTLLFRIYCFFIINEIIPVP